MSAEAADPIFRNGVSVICSFNLLRIYISSEVEESLGRLTWGNDFSDGPILPDPNMQRAIALAETRSPQMCTKIGEVTHYE